MRRLVDRWIPLLAATSFLIAALIDAATRYLWVDEILTTTLVRDPSLSHMLHALGDQVDTSPPLFYMVAWGWARIFGASAVSLRLLSAVFMSIAFAVLWRTLRPFAPLAIRAAAALGAVLVPQVVLFQMTEARAYGLLMLLCALTLWQVDRIANGERAGLPLLAGVMLTQAALCLTHTLGFMYSSASLGALVVAGLIRRRPRWGAYIAWAASWIAFVYWIPTLKWQLEVGNPTFPIPRPTLRHLANAISLGIPRGVGALILILLVIAVLIARRTEPYVDEAAETRDTLPLSLAAFAWMLAVFALWIASRVGRPLLLPRYVVPLSLAYAVAITLALQMWIARANATARRTLAAEERRAPAGSHALLLTAVAAIALAQPVLRATRLPDSGKPAGDSLDVMQSLPIATISTHTYLPRVEYAAKALRYVFILDSATAFRSDVPVGPTEYHLMDALRRNYPDTHWIENGETFLARTPRFLVIDEAGLYWFKRRVSPSPQFNVTLLYQDLLCGSGLPEDRCKVYLVERRPPPSP